MTTAAKDLGLPGHYDYMAQEHVCGACGMYADPACFCVGRCLCEDCLEVLKPDKPIHPPIKCEHCGRFAKVTACVPYADEFGYSISYTCAKCGPETMGT